MRNQTMKTMILTILSALAMFAQAPPSKSPAGPPTPAAKTASAPVISDALRARFWRVVAEQSNAQAQAQAANQAVQQVRSEIESICGADFTPSGDQRGEPTCVPKPAPAANPKP
jgi:hypothetical protein